MADSNPDVTVENGERLVANLVITQFVQGAVPVRPRVGIADRAVIVLDLECMQLEGLRSNHGTRCTSNRFVPRFWSRSPAVTPISSPEAAMPCSPARRAQSWSSS
jgi:hypothetical protein